MMSTIEAVLARSTPVGECLEWTGPRFRGYGRAYAPFRERSKWLAHRLVWELLRGPIPAGFQVNHRCDNPPCINVEHLWLGTQQDNMRDMRAKGRASRPAKKLSDADVVEIHRLIRIGARRTAIAHTFGISRSLVGFIAIGRRRKHVA